MKSLVLVWALIGVAPGASGPSPVGPTSSPDSSPENAHDAESRPSDASSTSGGSDSTISKRKTGKTGSTNKVGQKRRDKKNKAKSKSATGQHSVILATRLGRRGDDSEAGKTRITGIAATPRLIVVSTNAVGGQLPVHVRDASSPQRLAIKLAESTRSQYWEVGRGEGSRTRGQVRYVDTKHGVAMIELEGPNPNWQACEGAPEPGTHTLVLRNALVPDSFEVEVRSSSSGRIDVLTPVPAIYESGVAYTRDGQCVGLLVGAASPGAAEVLAPARLDELVGGFTRSVQDARSEVRWSAGVGLGTAIGPSTQVRSSFVARADLIIDRRWDLALETSWQAFNFEQLRSKPTYTELRTRRHHVVFAGVGSYLFGSPAQNVRAALALGGGLDLRIDEDKIRTLSGAEGCVAGDPCPIDLMTASRLQLQPLFDAIVGADLLTLRAVGKHGMVGIRVGYRFHLIVPSFSDQFHAIAVTIQL